LSSWLEQLHQACDLLRPMGVPVGARRSRSHDLMV
jgi:hypothetical protein